MAVVVVVGVGGAAVVVTAAGKGTFETIWVNFAEVGQDLGQGQRRR